MELEHVSPKLIFIKLVNKHHIEVIKIKFQFNLSLVLRWKFNKTKEVLNQLDFHFHEKYVKM